MTTLTTGGCKSNAHHTGSEAHQTGNDKGRKPIGSRPLADLRRRSTSAQRVADLGEQGDLFGRSLGRGLLAPVSYTHLDVYKRQSPGIPMP